MKFVALAVALVAGVAGQAGLEKSMLEGLPGKKNLAKDALIEAYKSSAKMKGEAFDENDANLQEMLAKLGNDMADLKEKHEREQRIRLEKLRAHSENPPKLQKLEKEFADQLLKDPLAQPSKELTKMREQREHKLWARTWKARWSPKKWTTWVFVGLIVMLISIMSWAIWYGSKISRDRDGRKQIKHDKLMANGKSPSENTTFLYGDDDDDDAEEEKAWKRRSLAANPNLVRRAKVSLS